jgi:hypothetical protein
VEEDAEANRMSTRKSTYTLQGCVSRSCLLCRGGVPALGNGRCRGRQGKAEAKQKVVMFRNRCRNAFRLFCPSRRQGGRSGRSSHRRAVVFVCCPFCCRSRCLVVVCCLRLLRRRRLLQLRLRLRSWQSATRQSSLWCSNRHWQSLRPSGRPLAAGLFVLGPFWHGVSKGSGVVEVMG